MTNEHDYSSEALAAAAADIAAHDQAQNFTNAESAAKPDMDFSGDASVNRSVRMSIDLHQRLTDAAKSAGIPASTLIRQAIEAHLAALDDDQPVSRAEVVKLVGMLRPMRDAGSSTLPHAA